MYRVKIIRNAMLHSAFLFLQGILTCCRSSLSLSFYLSFILVMKQKCISLKSVLILSPIPNLVYLICDLGIMYKIIWKFCCGLKLLPWWKRDRRPCSILRSTDWCLVIDISDQPISLILKGKACSLIMGNTVCP